MGHFSCRAKGRWLSGLSRTSRIVEHDRDACFAKDQVIRRRKVRWFERSPEKAFWLFAVFAAFVFLLGGGSRYDIQSVGPLRALGAIFLAVAIWWIKTEEFQRIKIPLILLLATAAAMLAQLIPLPPEWWHSLSGRETIIATERLLGLSENWRPVSLSPLRTFNSLASLVIPAATLLILSQLDHKGLQKVRRFVVIVGIVSAFLGVAQIVLRGSPGLYLYEITNSDSAVGLFSNRNHNALFLNIALLFSLFERPEKPVNRRWQENGLLIAVQLVLALGIVINASRFGLILLALNAIIFAGLYFLSENTGRKFSAKNRGLTIASGAFALISLALIAALIFLSRVPAITRLFSSNLAGDQRVETLPIIVRLATDHFPFGVGFGAFEQAFRMVEPAEQLGPRYLNHAHNDWLQILVEGGAAGVVLVILLFAYLVKSGFALWRNARSEETRGAWLGAFAILMIALHSAVDYPLRTPSLMLVAILALVLLTRISANRERV